RRPLRHRAAGRLLDRGDDLAHRVAAAGAEIERGAVAARLEIAQRPDMRIGEIGDVYVIAYRGTVGGRVIAAENPDRAGLLQRRPDDERDQMRLGVVVLADFAVEI